MEKQIVLTRRQALLGATGVVALAGAPPLLAALLDDDAPPVVGARPSGRISVLDYIPAALHVDIQRGSYRGSVRHHLQAAIDAHPSLYWPRGVYPVDGELIGRVGLHWEGDGYLNSYIQALGGHGILTLGPDRLTEAAPGLHRMGFRGAGYGAHPTSRDLLSFMRVGRGVMRDCGVRNSAGSLVTLHDNCIGWTFDNVLFENAERYAIRASKLSSVARVVGCQYNANVVEGVAFFGGEAVESWTFEAVNVNGDNRLGHFIQALGTGMARTTVRGCYMEFLRGAPITAVKGALFDGLDITFGLYSTGDSIKVADLANGEPHRAVRIYRPRVPSANGGYFFNPGATVDFEMRLPDLGGGTIAGVVVGYGAQQNVRR